MNIDKNNDLFQIQQTFTRIHKDTNIQTLRYTNNQYNTLHTFTQTHTHTTHTQANQHTHTYTLTQTWKSRFSTEKKKFSPRGILFGFFVRSRGRIKGRKNRKGMLGGKGGNSNRWKGRREGEEEKERLIFFLFFLNFIILSILVGCNDVCRFWRFYMFAKAKILLLNWIASCCENILTFTMKSKTILISGKSFHQ